MSVLGKQSVGMSRWLLSMRSHSCDSLPSDTLGFGGPEFATQLESATLPLSSASQVYFRNLKLSGG